MFKSFERADFSIFATFVYSYENMKIIAGKNKGIHQAVDLKGKKLAHPPVSPKTRIDPFWQRAH